MVNVLSGEKGLSALRRAIDLAGGQASLAKRLDEIGRQQAPVMRCKPQNVWAWLNRDMRVPGEWARFVAEAVNFQVVPAEIRPDIYPNPTDGLPADKQILGLLAQFSEVLTPAERATVTNAVFKGPEAAIGAIESLGTELEMRGALLAAARGIGVQSEAA
jgi:DNA-binding transcriptional regulator YdaS (Cro superfamily)